MQSSHLNFPIGQQVKSRSISNPHESEIWAHDPVGMKGYELHHAITCVECQG